MPSISHAFKLAKSQAELDFVDVPLQTDIPLFIDPYAISIRPDRWSSDAHATLAAFFQRTVDLIRDGHLDAAQELFDHLREPNETRFGYSRGTPQGAGIGRHQSGDLLKALAGSTAVKTGFITSLAECELMVAGIGRDKISDLTTNVIRRHLINYTQGQTNLHGIPTAEVPSGPIYDPNTGRWAAEYTQLPVWKGGPLLFVPKAIARYDASYNGDKYYTHAVLNFLAAEALEAGSSLVRTLKNKKQVVYKRDLRERYPFSKEFLYKFSKKHPEVLVEYRALLEQVEKEGPASQVEPAEIPDIALALIEALKAIPPGPEHAGEYHSLMIGAVELLFFPNLLNPRKEKEIHEGRKRIDIVMENGAQEGILHRLHAVRKLPCAFVAFECKNYGREIGNPEVDQLAGRFSPNRGKVGILCCRSIADRGKLIARCRDTLRDERGLILPIDDAVVIRWLKAVAGRNERAIDDELQGLVNEVWIS